MNETVTTNLRSVKESAWHKLTHPSHKVQFTPYLDGTAAFYCKNCKIEFPTN